ncbi:DPYS [Cordylochernes scorpioides]|uniref:DPYS n=1 Tax=Cordylochernes scorpioides TaxID=51811 RepID=A0ABY6KDF4_9ARAC|nr:DPYS [Cordylochernes scorpioides]
MPSNKRTRIPLQGSKTVDDFYQGTKAALAGGTTMINEKVCCDYGLHVAVTHWSEDVEKGHGDPHPGQSTHGTGHDNHGVNSFKMFLAYKDSGLMVENEDMLRIMEGCKRLGALAMVHAENGDVIQHVRIASFPEGFRRILEVRFIVHRLFFDSVGDFVEAPEVASTILPRQDHGIWACEGAGLSPGSNVEVMDALACEGARQISWVKGGGHGCSGLRGSKANLRGQKLEVRDALACEGARQISGVKSGGHGCSGLRGSKTNLRGQKKWRSGNALD